MLLEKQKRCNHAFKLIVINKKTLEGYYNDPRDYKEGEWYNMYYCKKCSLILSVDYNEKDITPVIEFEKKYHVTDENGIKGRIRK